MENNQTGSDIAAERHESIWEYVLSQERLEQALHDVRDEDKVKA